MRSRLRGSRSSSVRARDSTTNTGQWYRYTPKLILPRNTTGFSDNNERTGVACCKPAIMPALISAKSGSPPAYGHPRPAGVMTDNTIIAARHSGASHLIQFATPLRSTTTASNAPASISGMRAQVAKYAASSLHHLAVSTAETENSTNRPANQIPIRRIQSVARRWRPSTTRNRPSIVTGHSQ